MTKKNKKQDKAFDGFDFEEFKAEALEKLKSGLNYRDSIRFINECGP